MTPLTGRVKLGFNDGDRRRLHKAVDLAEETVADHYRYSEDFWRRWGRYELRTLTDLGPDEISDRALAQLVKCYGPDRTSPRPRHFFRICLQDHRIKAVGKRSGLDLQTLLAYVVTHELIHVVRFARHDQLFEAPPGECLAEEKTVHGLTGRLLRPMGLPDFENVLNYVAPGESGVTIEHTRWGAAPGARG